MTTEEQVQLANRSILQSLSDCRGYMLPEPVLFAQTNMMVVPPLTKSEFDERLKWLEAEGLIAGVNPKLQGPRKWIITDQGRASLA
jgi:hypothetical protein